MDGVRMTSLAPLPFSAAPARRAGVTFSRRENVATATTTLASFSRPDGNFPSA
jgi:hypothetical protein